MLDPDEMLLVTGVSPPIFGSQHCFRFRNQMQLMSAYFCPHSVFNTGYLIEFMCLKSDLIDNYDN